MVGVNFPINTERRSWRRMGCTTDVFMMVVRNANKRSHRLLTEVGNFRKVLRVPTSTKCNLPSKISNVSLFTALAAIRMCSSVTISIICSRFIQQLYATITYTRFPIFPLLDFALYKNVRLEK